MALLPSKLESLPSHLVEHIISLLPIPSIVQAASVCKSWNSLIHSPSFKSMLFESDPFPCLFISANILSNTQNPIYALNLKFQEWFKIGNSRLHQEQLIASNGYFLDTSPGTFHFKKIFSSNYNQTALPRCSEGNALIAAYEDLDFPEKTRFIVVGGNRKLDDEYREVGLAVDMYDPNIDSWEKCPPLPEIFRDTILTSSQLLSSVVYKGKFYVFDNESCLVSSFDMDNHSWSSVHMIRPPGVLFSYLISCGEQLVLAGVMYNISDGENKFVVKLWRVDARTLESIEIGMMPEELRKCFFHNKDQPSIFRCRSVGSGNVIYMFNVGHGEDFRACACEIICASECRWTKVPNLPEYVSKDYSAYEIISCNVSLQDILGKEFSE